MFNTIGALLVKKIIQNIDLGLKENEINGAQGKEPEFVLNLAEELVGDTFEFSGASEKVEGEEGNKEAQETQNGIKEAVTGLLSKIFSNESVKEKADTDADGVITEEEARGYLTSIADGDEDASSLSLEDVEKALEDLGIDPEEIINEEIKKHLEETKLNLKQEEVAEVKEKPTVTEAQASSASSAPKSTSTNGSSGSYRASSSQKSAVKDIKNMTINELTSAISEKTNEISTAQEELGKVNDGTHPDLVSLKEAEDKAFEEYQNKIAEKSEEDAKALGEARNNVDSKKSALDSKKTTVTQIEGELTTVKSQIDGCTLRITSLEGSISSLKGAISSAEEGADTSGLQTKLSSAETELKNAKDKKVELEDKEKSLNTELTNEKESVETLQKEYDEACETLKAIEEKYNDDTEVQACKQAYDTAKGATEAKKIELTASLNASISTKRAELNEMNTQLALKESKASEREYGPNKYNFNFDFVENMSERQKNELATFVERFEKNKDKYEAVAEATGMPAELIAAIHWREGSGNFETYLHNGQKLGQTTTLVPAGIYFEDWTEAAIDAINRCKSNARMENDGSLEYYLSYAEGYNGWGYHNKGKESPYVWAGTTNYDCGKYVADGKYDPNYVDQQLGVALMMKALMA